MGGGYQVEVANGKRNLWDDELSFIEPESEHSAASTCEGFAVAGGRVTNFTSGQGLILMKEVLYTISGKRLPIVFHHRDAFADFCAILREEWADGMRGVVHCFTGDRDALDYIVECGYYVSISGIITYKNSHLRELIRHIPIDSLLVETDSPYLPPQTHRGQRNDPSHIPTIAAAMAELKHTTRDAVAAATTANAKVLFRLR